MGRGEKAEAFLYVRVGSARFQSMYSKKVKRSAFQKHHTALCNEARYHIRRHHPTTSISALGDLSK